MPADPEPIPYRKIQILQESVARKIAAGEVIDRPQAVLRELLDNALDSGAQAIEVRWDDGGITSLEVVDNGVGMDQQDLELCWKPHATSKIVDERDLESLTSLGFRGEALASIAACARLQIDSAQPGSLAALRLIVEDQVAQPLQVTAGVPGTRVLVENLFSSLPARRRFLKNASAESTLCRRVFDEKAASFPQVSFTLTIDGQRKVEYPRQSEEARLAVVLGSPWTQGKLIRWTAEGEGFCVRGYAVKPPLGRTDRKGLRVWANRRPLQEFSLGQAMSYAFEGYLPGGVFPWSVLFVEADPALVDFNIHPAKREARFRHLPAIHQATVAALRLALEEQAGLRFEPVPRLTQARELPGLSSQDTFSQGPLVRGRAHMPSSGVWDTPLRPEPHDVVYERSENKGESRPFRYLGQVLGVFLIAEVGEDLYLVDQHAAHERILFDAFRDHGGRIQPLLFPLRFRPEEDSLELMKQHFQEYEGLGILIQPVENDEFELKALPATVAGQEKALIAFLRTNLRPVSDVEKDLYASLSCRAAVMDGDPLDPETARGLVRKAFALPHARCPHGRPIWTVLTRQELFAKVGRTLF